MRLYTCVCECVCILCIDCGSWYRCFSVWTVSCMHVCVRVHMYAYAYVCRYIYMCILLQWVLHALYRCFGHLCMGRCVHYTGVFLHQRTHLRTHSLQVVHICVYVYKCVYACICIWMRMSVYDIAWHDEVLLLRFSICAYVYICMRMYMCVQVCVYWCMCTCMYMYICMYMYAYLFIYTRMWVCICTRVGALFIYTIQPLYYMRVYHRCFLTLACVCRGELEVGFVSGWSWLALVTGVGGYASAGVEIEGLSCKFLYFCGC